MVTRHMLIIMGLLWRTSRFLVAVSLAIEGMAVEHRNSYLMAFHPLKVLVVTRPKITLSYLGLFDLARATMVGFRGQGLAAFHACTWMLVAWLGMMNQILDERME